MRRATMCPTSDSKWSSDDRITFFVINYLLSYSAMVPRVIYHKVSRVATEKQCASDPRRPCLLRFSLAKQFTGVRSDFMRFKRDRKKMERKNVIILLLENFCWKNAPAIDRKNDTHSVRRSPPWNPLFCRLIAKY